MTVAIERLHRLLGGDALAGLRRRLRERYRRVASAEMFTLSSLTPVERQALENLLGRSASCAGSMRLSQQALDESLARAGIAVDLRSALETLDGPIVNTAADRQQSDDRWGALFAGVEQPRLRQLVNGPMATSARSLIKRLGRNPDGAGALLDRAARVLDELPGNGISRSQLAARALGDAHALDDGALATIVLRAWIPLRGEWDDPEQSRNRNLWAEAGVIVDGLSRPVLTLNLTCSAGFAALACESGEPLHLSLRKLLLDPPLWQLRNRAVFVCENPAIVTLAADRLGARGAPLVCTDGMPAAAQRTLLEQLAQAGARLRYHGDFDWPGIAIGNFMMRRFGATPWRFGSADYIARKGVALDGGSVAASWDETLGAAMISGGYALHEEAVADALILDLSSG